MDAHPHSRLDIARRLAARLGVELHPELVELVPPVDWDEFPTRTELRDELGRHHEHVDRRLTAIRDALAAAHHDNLRRMIGWHVVTVAAVAALAFWAGAARDGRARASTDAGS